MQNISISQFNSVSGMKKFIGDALLDASTTFAKRNREFWKAHCECSNFYPSKREFKNHNIFDMTKYTDTISTFSKEMANFAKEAGFYSILPCLSSGIVWINRTEGIYYEVISVNIDLKIYKIHISQLLKMSDGALIEVANICAYIEFLSSNETEYFVQITTDDSDSNVTTIKPDALYIPLEIVDILETTYGWDAKCFKKYIDLFYLAFTQEFGSDMSRFESTHILDSFIRSMFHINYLLDRYRPSVIRRKSASGRSINAAPQTNESAKMRVRHIGPNITIQSVKVPKVVNSETIKKYKVSSWVTRGHIRTYKDGRKVYIKESVKHRKCLQEGSNPPSKKYVFHK